MFKLGLTGSIGMGKSTTAALFADLGCDVWDADAAVHRLYSKDGLAVLPMKASFPDAVVDRVVSREKLRDVISKNPSALIQIEQIVHPLLVQDRAEFVQNATSDILVYDIPLLFETGGQDRMDAVACVWTTPDIQEQRVMARGTMSKAQFETIRAKQMPADEKRERSDFVIVTDTIENAHAQVQTVLTTIRQRMSNA
ncbi:MAG: dephospho-CoA kinase [Lentilitoribacter sp.]